MSAAGAATYTIWLHAPLGQRLAGLVPVALRYHRALNAVGWLDLLVPFTAELRALVALDSRLELWRTAAAGHPALLATGTVWLVRYVAVRRTAAGAALLEIGAVSAGELLRRRIVAAAADSPAANRRGPADDVMKALVRDNLVAPADPARAMPQLAVAGNTGSAPVVTKSCAHRPLWAVLRELAQQSLAAGRALYFDMEGGYGGLPFLFTTWPAVRGRDHTAPGFAQPVTLQPEAGTLGAVTRAWDAAAETTAVYAGGQGLGANRQLVVAVDGERVAASPWNRRERFVAARQAADGAALAAEANAVLAAGRPRRSFVATVVAQPAVAYGTAWQWGDLLTVVFAGEVLRCVVHAVTVTVDAGVETVVAELRSV